MSIEISRSTIPIQHQQPIRRAPKQVWTGLEAAIRLMMFGSPRRANHVDLQFIRKRPAAPALPKLHPARKHKS